MDYHEKEDRRGRFGVAVVVRALTGFFFTSLRDCSDFYLRDCSDQLLCRLYTYQLLFELMILSTSLMLLLLSSAPDERDFSGDQSLTLKDPEWQRQISLPAPAGTEKTYLEVWIPTYVPTSLQGLIVLSFVC